MTGPDSVSTGCSHKRDSEGIGSPTVEGPATACDDAGPTAHPASDYRESRSMPSIPATPHGTTARASLAALWLSEMWKPCSEVPREERAAQRALRAAEHGR